MPDLPNWVYAVAAVGLSITVVLLILLTAASRDDDAHGRG